MTPATSSLSNKTERIYWPEIDGLRSLAFLLVFIHHFNERHIQLLSGIPMVIMGQIGLWGWTGVDLFFVLSGFLITSLLLKERVTYNTINYRHFLMRRVLRIWPLYFFAIILGFVILPLLHWQPFEWGSKYWHMMVSHYTVPYAVFMGNFSMAFTPIVPITPMVSILWSVCIEEQFYVFWGATLKMIKKPVWITLLTLALLVASYLTRSVVYWFNPASHHPYYYITLSHLDPLLIGILIALMLSFKPQWFESEGKRTVVIRTSVLATGIFLILSTFSNFRGIYQNDISMIDTFFWIALGWGCLLLSVIYVPFLKQFFKNKFLVHLGKISYGLYVFHNLGISVTQLNPVEALVKPLGIFSYAALMIIALATIYLCATLSWHLLEKPFLRKKEHFARIFSKTAID